MAADPTLARLVRRGADYAEFFEERSSSLLVHLEDGRVQKVLQGDESGLGLRVLSGDQTYYTYAQRRGAASGRALAAELGSVIGARDTRAKRHRYLRVGDGPAPPRRRIAAPVPTALAALVRRVDRLVRRVSPAIRQVVIAGRERRQDVRIANSLGENARDRRSASVWMVQVVAADGAVIQTGYETAGGSAGLGVSPPDTLERIGVAAARRAVQMLSARPAPGGRMPVVLSSEAGGTMIHEAVGHGLEADLAQEGFSVYAKKRGRRIAGPLISVVDDPTLCGMRGSYTVDDEGVAAERTLLVDRGVLRTYLFDRLSAAKDGRASNGHGRRQSYHQRPIPRMSNTMILPGTDDPARILGEVKRGLLVRKMGGGQVNTVNGDFVFEVTEGYRIEGGEVAYPVRGATLVGNGPEVLRTIDRVGTDLGFALGTCGKGGQGVPVSDAQPTLRIPELTVGGTESP
ncbi:MAG: TldD/PmbA family protein [Candidatus Methylomirabilia bacterium]